ncbi:Low-density lipoprotein receptor 1 [Armadillidium vulgare]|nr:Low-density lipoprotein receptor 1 [Armadillidium vulgare]
MILSKLIESILICIYSTNVVSAFSLSGISCPDNEKFQCDTFKCIPRQWLCDGSQDCQDKTDEQEENCPTGVTLQPNVCRDSQFKCDNGICLPIKWKCDGTDDCGDGSDEVKDLCKHNCTSREFMCGNGQCITRNWRCDGHQDCIDGSDEINCTTVSERVHKGYEIFRCDNGFEIPILWRCDGDSDCKDKTDEEDCGTVENKPESSTDEKRTSCRDTEFKCPKSFCILKSWICDGTNDCPNGEDEQDCKENICDPGTEFRCLDGSGCVKIAVKCDGTNHCLDGSDETECPPRETTTNPPVIETTKSSSNITSKKESSQNATSDSVQKSPQDDTDTTLVCDPETHYLCSDGKCIPNEKLCDGKGDCRDRKDESVDVCGINECKRNNGGCMHICKDTRGGHDCKCYEGYKLVGKYNCEDINECTEIPGTCSQLCENTMGGFRCSCMPGYLRDPADITRCKAAAGEVYLLFSHSYDIRSLRLRDRDMTSVVKDTRSAIALDYLFADGKILWSDRKDKKIYRASLADTSASREILASDKDISADGLAVDWIHRNVYYTDTKKSAVNLLSWDAQHFKTLATEELGHPRAIAVAPFKGYVYWTDWGLDAKIERAMLDGSDRKAIVTEPHVAWPNGITIDPSTDRMYWCDGRLRTISSANLDGSDIKVILYSPTFLRQPFSITVFEDRLYWTDWSKTALFSANKFTGSGIQNVSAGHMLESPKVVHVYHQYRQPGGENICSSHSCSHFCVRSPEGEAICTCADDYVLDKDGHTCIKKDKVASITGDLNERYPLKAEYKQEEMAVKNIKEGFSLYEQAEKSSRVGFIVGGCFGALTAIGVVLALYMVYNRMRQKPIKRIRFHNPVYRKTTCDDLVEDRGFVIGQDQLFYNPTANTPKLTDSETQYNDADDVPLAPKDQDEE